MTHSGGKPHAVGDEGQRFEVTVYDNDLTERIVIGWSDDAELANKMATSAVKRPSWDFEQVRDRNASA